MRARVALLVLMVTALAAGWWCLAPTAVGGRATYVVTHGVSMQPRFHTGDLALVYPASDYRPGDVAAYRSSLLHTVVLHRVVDRTADGYVFKGDNNTWLDPEHPTNEQMVGRLGVRVPHGGAVLGWIHNPAAAGLLAAAVAGLGATGSTGLRRRRQRRRARRRTRPERTPMSLHLLRHAGPTRWAHRAIAAAAALLFAGLVAATYLVPGKSSHAEEVPWTTQLNYGYTATTDANVVYPDGNVHSGDTVFRKLVDTLMVRAMWSLRTPAAHHLEGTLRLQAIVHGPAGWTHTLNLGSAQGIDNGQAVVSVSLELNALDALIGHAATLTGVPAESYTVSVQPVVDLNGTLAGEPFNYHAAGSDSALSLAVTPATVAPATAAGAPASGAAASASRSGSAGAASEWLAPQTDVHSTVVTTPVTRGWPVHGILLPLRWIRWVGIGGATAALVVLLLLLMVKPGWTDPCVPEARRYRGSIIAVSGRRLASTGNILDVASMGALVQVAQRYDRLILQETNTPGTYVVEDETGLYRYQCPHRRSRPVSRRHLADHPPMPRPDAQSA